MKLYNELKLRFDEAIWALYPELALFDVLLAKHPIFVQMVSKDVLAGLKDSNFGRKDSPTVDQILRAAIYKEIKQLTYRDLEKDMYDSKICAIFLQLDNNQGYSYSVMQKYISKIQEETIRSIMVKVNQIAISESIETMEKVSSDTTVVETNVHYPTNNSLVYDCIQTATRLLGEIKKKDAEAQKKLEEQRKAAKKYNYQINNTKKEDMPALFLPYLAILKLLILESWRTVRSGTYNSKEVNELKEMLPLLLKVYRISEKKQIHGEIVPNEEKIFSIYEPHTNIIVKGQREQEFGHKVLITRGGSNLILDYKVLEGNPNDKILLMPSLDRLTADYQIIPQNTSNDGGFFSKANIEACKEKGIVNIVFTKVTQSVKNIVSSPEIETVLKKWRGTTEAVISNLKRGFGLERVLWEGFEKFCAKVAWSVLGYNLRVIINRLF